MTHTAAITRKTSRRQHDRYFTPTSAVDTLLNYVSFDGLILEPCCGEGAIANHLMNCGHQVVATDIVLNPKDDATTSVYWSKYTDVSWVITNPPFYLSSKIVPRAYHHSKIGVAFLLRLSYLEPCLDRGGWLAEHPPNLLIVMPRISFSGDGKVDSCTTAWMLWFKGQNEQKIIVVSK